MFKHLNQKRQRGQSTLEYAILIIIIIGALLSIQVYIKRGVQGRLKSATDDIGDQFNPAGFNGTITTQTDGQTRDTSKGGTLRSEITLEEVSTTNTDLTTVTNIETEFWGKN